MVYDIQRSSQEKVADWLFYLVMALFPFERAFIVGGEGAFMQYFILLHATVAVFSWRLYYQKLHWAIISYIIFLIIGTLSDLRTLGFYSNRILWDLMRSWIGCYMMVPAYNMARRSHAKAVVLLYLVLWFSLITAICQFAGIGVSEIEVERGVEGVRTATLGANANGTARVVSIAILFSAIVATGGITMKNKYFLAGIFLASGFCFLALVRTGSRGGLLMCVLAVACVVLTARSLPRKILSLLVIGLIGVIIIAFVLNNQTMMDRINKAVYENDTGGRDRIREVCMYLWSQAKWLGYGCLVHKFIIGSEVGILQRATHNTFLYAMMSGGICGSIFYFITLGTAGWKAFRIRKYPWGNFSFLVLMLFLLSGWVMNIEGFKVLYILYGVVLGMSEKINRDKKLQLPCFLDRWGVR